jgi:hypothetical protein
MDLLNAYLQEGKKNQKFTTIYKLSYHLLPYRLDGVKLVWKKRERERFLPLRDKPWPMRPRRPGEDIVQWMLEHAELYDLKADSLTK